MGIPVDFILPVASKETLMDVIFMGRDGIHRVKASLCNIGSAKATAFDPKDEAHVKKLISVGGFEAVNGRVAATMTSWIGKVVEVAMNELVRSDSGLRGHS